jgi:putative dimethyl sulfoxide reductase chaperone
MNKRIENAISRKKIYSFFAEIFLQEPTPSRWSEQCNALEKFFEEESQLEGYEDQVNHLIPESLMTAVEKVKQEFYDSFFVPMSGRYVPSFESALRNYTGGRKRAFGPLSSSEGSHVAQCYAAVGFYPWGLEVFAPLREIRLPDHIGFELAFMATLCSSEILAWENRELEKVNQWQNLQKQFLKEHLNEWLPHFAEAMRENAPGYYAKVAKAAKQWVNTDFEDLEQGDLIA